MSQSEPSFDPLLRRRLSDDLKGVFQGDLFLSDTDCALYATDASLFEVAPLAVAAPRDEADLQVLVRYARDHHLPLIPRGAGTGVSGEALGTGIVVDFSPHFRDILEVDSDCVRVQPGVVLQHLNEQLAQDGRRFAPDPASAATCTIGGMVATNASGSRSLKHGYTRDHVLALRLVLDTGDVSEVSRHPRSLMPTQPPEEPLTESGTTADAARHRLETIVTDTIELLEANCGLIALSQPRVRYNRCGYLLGDVLDASHLNLARLLVGSEGTLGLWSELTLKTIPLPVSRAVVLLGFPSLEAALKASSHVRSTRPAALELLDRRLLSLARSYDAASAHLVPAGCEAVLLIEYEGDDPEGAARQAHYLIRGLPEADRHGLLAPLAVTPQAIDRLWGLRDRALPRLYGLSGGTRPILLIEDAAVPPEKLTEFVTRLQGLLKQHELTASFLIHAGSGHVETRPFLNLDCPDEVAKLRPLAEAVHTLALELGGTISARHGVGIARTPWVAAQYGPLYGVFRQLKRIFDPANLFNPGKIVGPDPSRPIWPIRSPVGVTRRITDAWSALIAELEPPPEESAEKPWLRTLPVLNWQPDELLNEVKACSGCGDCRVESASTRMCPLFRVNHAEPATPRAKANLLRRLLQPHSDVRDPNDPAVLETIRLCVNCKMCRLGCPSRVNVPKLMLETKAAHMSEHGLDRSDWVLARTESFAAIGSHLAPLVNPMLSSRVVRWFLEKVFGISRHRRMPTFAYWDFLGRARRRGWSRKPETPGDSSSTRVAYFSDVFANYNDPEIGVATVLVLRHHGLEVLVPASQSGCGMAPLAQGDVETAREAAQTNLRALADLAREGYRIVCSEPTAALMLSQDYLDLIGDADARLVANQTVELTAFLGELHRAGRLRTDFQPLELSLGHHVPCHLKAWSAGQRDEAVNGPWGPRLLELIPGVRVRTIDISCSGMAGTYGLKADHYHASLEAGRPMLDVLRQPELLHGSTECSACRLQMEDATGKRTLHPVQYLALAYGLMPELRSRLDRPIRSLVLP